MDPNRLQFPPNAPSSPASHNSGGLSNLSSAPSRHPLSTPPSSSESLGLGFKKPSKHSPKHSSGSNKKKPKGLANIMTNYMAGGSNSAHYRQNKHGDMVFDRPSHGTINNDGMRSERRREENGTIVQVAASRKKRKDDKIKSKGTSSSTSTKISVLDSASSSASSASSGSKVSRSGGSGVG